MGRTGTFVGAGLAALGIAGTAAAAAARVPVVRRWPLSVVPMLLGMPASEAPQMLTAVHTAAGVASGLAALGDRRHRAVTLAATALNAAAVGGLTGLRDDAERSAAILDGALRELGGPPLASVAGPIPGPLARARSVRTSRARLRVAVDVRYGPEPENLLDVWARPGLTGPAPVLVQVHGGAWTSGAKDEQALPLMTHLTERGWICVAVGYRLGPAHRWPSMIVDVKRAIGWIREHIGEYGGDPGFVAITGGSAGGHLAALAALSPNDPDFQPGFTDVDTRLDAAVPLYGVHDFTVDEYGLFGLLEGSVFTTTLSGDERGWRQASPVHRVSADAPPFLVVHGDTDTVAGVGQSRRLVAALRRVGAPVCYAELPHAQHAFDALPSRRTVYTLRAIERFLTAARERAGR